MFKKILGIPLLIVSMVFFIQCSKDLSDLNVNPFYAPDGKGRPGGGETTAGNNLSFPVIAVDGFAITPLTTPSFTVPYTGNYPGLSAEEIASLTAAGPWYPQQTTGNAWQADYATGGPQSVTFIDWGDNIESVYPKIRSPFRLEVTLYEKLTNQMTGYTMGVLENPSSADELQGTNTETFEGDYATIVSVRPKLVIQYLGSSVPDPLIWGETSWYQDPDVIPTIIPITFQPELNVGGKYVYGASTGGWKPTQVGYYRLTFYVPTGSGVNLANAEIANASNDFGPPTEGGAATPLVDMANNLTYVDVLVKSGGGGGGGGGGRRP